MAMRVNGGSCARIEKDVGDGTHSSVTNNLETTVPSSLQLPLYNQRKSGHHFSSQK